jgi:superfamily I DNA/RNA helicase
MAHFRIFDNIRNSRQIAELAAKFAETKLIARGPISFEIEYIEADPKHIMEAADDVVSQLTDQELWIPGEISLLTTKTRHPVHSEIADRDKARYWREFWQADSVFYGTVGGFKGLERSVVVLVLNGFHNAGDYQEFLYAGITRARDKLIVVGAKKECDLIRDYHKQ